MNTFLIYILLIVYAAMSMLLLFLMGADKKRAQNGAWRIPEKRLFMFALLGGAVGGVLGMKIFRHKTKHWYFKIGFPALAAVQLGILVYLIILG